ncbi:MULTISPECIES: DUF2889 domain-containing protein [unclassified Novosphingobium]|uniref:DUF2889 domain-containing protein n=1 Tax=unclassified Novosphingobium TaxID=2644732 RepID=UPI00135A400B|nr:MULTISPECIES: DUF2889 domain-containing protein [unclassified Novosphingobium]
MARIVPSADWQGARGNDSVCYPAAQMRSPSIRPSHRLDLHPPGDVFAMPGYRRVIRIEPGKSVVRSMLEDDLHAMLVELRHEAGVVMSVAAFMDRAPWSPCPGAEKVLGDTFTGLPLTQVTARRDKQANCTHLHDLAVLAASHATDAGPSEYSIAASDPCGARRVLEIRRDGAVLHHWIEQEGVLTAPGAIAGQSLVTLRDWIAGLSGEEQEAARLLQWAALVAHGRTLTEAEKHAALFHRPSCYTMQPERAELARAKAPTQDFSQGPRPPLAGMAARFEASRKEREPGEESPAPSRRMGDERWK